MSRLPVLVDLDALSARLAREESELASQLASLEDRIRRFEAIERPAFDEWLRVELGPRFSAFEELIDLIRMKERVARRVAALVNEEGYHPREALYLATLRAEPESADSSERDDTEGGAPGGRTGSHSDGKRPGAWDADEVEARRSAKRDAKRAARKEARKDARKNSAATATDPSVESARKRLVTVYRTLARRLHPDSPTAIGGERGRKLWLEVQASYETGNIERLLAVVAWLGDRVGSIAERSVASFSERYDRLRSQRKAQAKLLGDLEKFSLHPAWGFGGSGGVGRRKLLKRAARELDEELARAQEALVEIESFLESIGSPRMPKKRRR